MNKQEFLVKLRRGLSGLPQEDLEERLAFFAEMIDDRMEEGLTEAESVREIGDVDQIIDQIIKEIPFARIVKEKIRTKRKMSVLEMLLLILGAPIWLSLLIACLAVLLSVYIVLWSLVLCLWAAEISLWAAVLAGILEGNVFLFQGNGLSGIAMFGAAVLCTGLSIFLFFGCKAAGKGMVLLTKQAGFALKNRFVKKEVRA